MTDRSAASATRRPAALTLALATVLAAAGVLLAGATPGHALLGDRPDLVAPDGIPRLPVILALAAALLVAELGVGLVEFRHQAYAFSLTGAALLVGTLYAQPRELVAVRVVTALVAFAVQRTPAVKVAYNVSAYLLDAALLAWLGHAAFGPHPVLDLRTSSLLGAALAAVDLLMSVLVLVVITVHGGRITARGALGVLLPAVAVAAVNATIGVTCAVLLGHGELGALLLLATATISGMTYRGYIRLRRRHQSLEVIQHLIEAAGPQTTLPGLAAGLLGQVREALRAAGVDLVLRDEDGTERRFRDRVDGDAGDAVAARDAAGAGHPAGVRFDDLPNRPMVVSSRSVLDADHALLAAYGADELLVVPLSRGRGRATLVAVDRLGDAARFTSDDLALLNAVGGHLSVALRNLELVDELRWEATHDVLTGLANRAFLLERLEEALASRSAILGPAVLLLDLNRFKEVNDTLGHHVGDELLQVVSQRLLEVAGPDDTVARLGGDEFVVLLPAVEPVAAQAVTLAERIAERLRSPVELHAATLSTEASIGLSRALPEDTAADVLRHADTAMYASKASGEPHVVYTPELDAGRGERLALLADLHLALERGELILYYQPKLDLRTNRVTGVESLLRWQHPRLGWLSPSVFMPIAESTGLIELVIEHVLDLALTQSRRWMDQGITVTTAVNVSARNLLNPHLPDLVRAVLDRTGVPADRLVLEITESSVMGDPTRTMPVIERLAGLGAALSLDDFGTGYSSLSYLQRLPVKEVKIDRSFVVGLTDPQTGDTSRILVESIIGLGANLGLRVVAEGVEDEDTLQLLRDLGCDVVQGYLTGRPAPAENLRLTAPRVPAPRSGPADRVPSP